MNVIDRFLRYVKFDTQSDDDNGYLMASLPSNVDKAVPVVGFIAHLDTAPDMSGRHVNPRIVEKYDGGVITLNEKEGIQLSPEEFPEMLNYVGNDLIVTDGTTLLGADDKAGIAEIISAVAYLQAHPEVKHGKIRIAFNPDEEIGKGAHKFDVEHFGAEFGYTMDGGAVGELEYENFNAAGAKITIKGRNVHPGTAKRKMVNSIRVANQFIQMLPRWETPEHTEGYEGFYHLIGINGTVEETTLSYIIRDHDRARFESRKREIEHLVRKTNEEYPGCCTAEIHDQYYNMREKIEPVIHIISLAEEAMRAAGVEPKVQPIRGEDLHGRYEYVPIQSMEKARDVVVNICRLLAERD